MCNQLFPQALSDTDLVPLDDLKVSVASPSVQYGEALFEGVMAYPDAGGGLNVVALRQHLERLFGSALVVYPDLSVPVTVEQALDGIGRMLRANDVREQAYVRPSLLRRGPADLHLNPTDGSRRLSFSAYAQPCRGPIKQGLRCVISPMRKPSHLAARHKLCGLYAYFDMAHDLAMADGYDEGILLDERGLVAEGVYQNLILESQDGHLYTPQHRDRPILPSVTLAVIRRLLASRRQPGAIHSFDVTPESLCQAKSIVMVGTAAEVNYATEVSWNRRRHPINGGRPSALVQRLTDLYRRFVRGELGHEDLLYRV